MNNFSSTIYIIIIITTNLSPSVSFYLLSTYHCQISIAILRGKA